MPNIEIHGLDSDDSEKIENRLRDIFAKKPYFDEIVVTIALDSVRDLRSRNFPFLRVVNTREEKNEEIIRLLREAFRKELDIELLILEAFHPLR